VKHIMASGALPPHFLRCASTASCIGRRILSNTPPRWCWTTTALDSLIFTVHLWNPVGAEPGTMAEVLTARRTPIFRRIAGQITQHQQTHRLRHIINELAARLPDAERDRRRCAN